MRINQKIFNKKSAWAIVSGLEGNNRVIGVRIRGLWGSMWSRAWEGETPNLVATYAKASWILVANALFFCPRRRVTIELEDITSQARELAARDRKAFNDGLEDFYNKYGEEHVLFLRHYFYAPPSRRSLPGRIVGSVADIQGPAADSSSDIPPRVLDELLHVLSDELSLSWADVTINSNLTFDLGIDSVTMVSIVTAVEDHFKLQVADVAAIKTMRDLCMLAMGKLSARVDLKPVQFSRSAIPPGKLRVDASRPVHQLFLETFSRHEDEPFLWDNMLGSCTRKDFFLKAMVVSGIIKEEVPGQYVGVMLPALQSTTLLVAATYMAGKTPVMLNWTVGPQVLKHCVDTVALTHIITATAFFDKIRDKLPGEVKDRCVMLDKKVRDLTLLAKLRGLAKTIVKPSFSVGLDDVAVILFTSGSESQPKAVPLTHRNLLRDLECALLHVDIMSDSLFLSFLPPFHSFGFTIMSYLPLATGMKVAYTPDPTATREVVEVLRHTGANTVISTPTFLKMMLSVSSPGDLKTLRLVISGAESLPLAVIDDFRRKTSNALILEGYGITECSPILTINPASGQKLRSVGTFLSSVEYAIVDLQTGQTLPAGKEGMIMVRGDNVFNGYMDKAIASPFARVSGKDFYKTGDLGYVDGDGFLFITGRLKRFIKIAGEMISLPAVEQVMLEKYGEDGEVVLAVEGSDAVEPPQVVLFSTRDIELEDANRQLKNAGFSNLVKIHKLVKVDAIPLLGSGKADYKVLKQQIS